MTHFVLRRWRRYLCMQVLLGVSATFAASPGVEDAFEQRFLDGLLQRRLFSLAEFHCRDHLDDTSLSMRAHAEWTARLLGVFAEEARHADAAQRPALWTKVVDVVMTFEQAQPTNRWLSVVRYQAALATLTRAELKVLPAELGLTDPTADGGALSDLRLAVKELTDLEQQIDEQLRWQARDRSADELAGPTQNQLKALRARVYIARGRVHLYQARLYKPETPDHLNACLSALKYLGKISPADVTPELWMQSPLKSVAARRLKRDWSQAEDELDKLLQLGDSTKLKLLARAERIRLALAQDQGDQAQNVIANGREIDGQVDPGLDLAHLETLLYHWRTARQDNRAQAAQSWRKKAVELVHIIERDHSPYWLQRAESMLASTVAAGAGSDFDVLQRAAKTYYLRGRFDEAVTAYERASEQAERFGDDDAAFRLAFQAAAIQRQRDEFVDATERFRAVALKYPARSEAAGAHELAILAMAADLRRNPADTNQYASLLTEHLEKWPTATSADKVRFWLAKLYQHQRQFWAAAKLYCEISGDINLQGKALERAKQCFVTAIDDETVKDAKLGEAIGLLQRHYIGVRGQYNSSQRQAAMIAAHLRLRFARHVNEADLERIAGLMESFLDEDPEIRDPGTGDLGTGGPGTGNPAWRDRAQSLLVAAFAGQEEWSRAEHELGKLQHPMTKTWFELLALITTHRPSATQQKLGKLQLTVVERLALHHAELSDEQRILLSRWQADALMRTGDFAQAQVVLRPLVEQRPKDGQLQETYAQALLQSDTPAVLKRALAQWRTVLRRSKPQSSRWFRAKYTISLTHFKLGQPQRAAEIIKVLAALHPDLGGDEMRVQFQELLAKCKR